MYELQNGSSRLVHALDRLSDDPERMVALAGILFYCNDQLKEDIRALVDYYETAQLPEGTRA